MQHAFEIALERWDDFAGFATPRRRPRTQRDRGAREYEETESGKSSSKGNVSTLTPAA
jgi:hypothetical protein